MENWYVKSAPDLETGGSLACPREAVPSYGIWENASKQLYVMISAISKLSSGSYLWQQPTANVTSQ